jgi:hypothetical protein
MWGGIPFNDELPLDDQGVFEDLDRIRIEMLNEPPPEPAEAVFAGERRYGTPVLESLRFFRWVLNELYGGSVYRWEESLERRDERLTALLQYRSRYHELVGAA